MTVLFSWAPKSLWMVTAAINPGTEPGSPTLQADSLPSAPPGNPTNLDSVLKSRDITLLTRVCIVKAMVFPVVMYGCESWTIKKAE